MKLDKIKFAKLIHFIGNRLNTHLNDVFIESLDELIDVDVEPVKTYQVDAHLVDAHLVDDLLRQIANPDGFIPAIKAYRSLTGAGLKEAKEAVERYRVIPKYRDSEPAANLGDILRSATKSN